MVELILTIVFFAGLSTLLIPEDKIKRVNTPILGMFAMCVTTGYIVFLGCAEFVSALVDYIKGWF